MAKNMYQKREERKNKNENENADRGLHKTVINWDIGTNVKPPSNPYNISFY